jgi:hypothetical protein
MVAGLALALGIVGCGAAGELGCAVTLEKQSSSTSCTGRFGCFTNDTKWMWAGGGCRGIFLCNGNANVSCGSGFGKKLACPCVAGAPPPPPFAPPPAPPPVPPAPPAPQGPLCDINGTWNMTVGVGPVLNGGLHMGDMFITQTAGSRNYSLHWRDGHGTWPPGGEPAHPTVHGEHFRCISWRFSIEEMENLLLIAALCKIETSWHNA